MEMTQEQGQKQKPRAMVPAVCAVDGCTAKRKYRLVRDWERGACGMDHLHVLERQSDRDRSRFEGLHRRES